MNVDFGLLCLFTIQVALVFLVYHAWKGIKAEISALEAHRRDNATITASLAALRAEIEAVAKRMGEVEAAPKAGKARMEEIGELLAKADRKAEALETKVVSLNARLSSVARWKPKVNDEEETDPASQDEGSTIPMGQMPPGSIPLTIQPQAAPASVVPPGFGVVGRRTRHG